MDTTISRTYKNAEIVYIVEEDLITTGKVYIGADCIATKEYSCGENADGVPFTAKNKNAVLADLRNEVDIYMAECVSTISR